MTNPYFEQVTQLPAYGRFDPKVPGFLAEVSLDPEEEVVSSVYVNHGPYQVGHLAITSQRLRFFRRLLRRGHDHWPLVTTMVLEQAFPPVILLGAGWLFQARSLRPGPIRQFVALHQVLVEALEWDARHQPPEPVPVVVADTGVSLAAELAGLDRLRQEGTLNPAEFEVAKRKLLGTGG